MNGFWFIKQGANKTIDLVTDDMDEDSDDINDDNNL